MSIYKVIFSPTGGTQKAADLLTAALGNDIKQIDISAPDFNAADISLHEDDIAVLAAPSFGGRLPIAAAERLAGLRGNGAKAVLLCVYGNRAFEDTLVELCDIAVAGGFSIVAAVAAIAEHSIVRDIAAGRPDAEDASILASYGQRILEKIEVGGTELPEIPGNRPYKNHMGKKLIPKTSSDCIGCGLCAEKCPVAAIDKNNPRHTDEAACLACMRCISLCPQKARALNKLMAGAVSVALKVACSKRKECCLYI